MTSLRPSFNDARLGKLIDYITIASIPDSEKEELLTRLDKEWGGELSLGLRRDLRKVMDGQVKERLESRTERRAVKTQPSAVTDDRGEATAIVDEAIHEEGQFVQGAKEKLLAMETDVRRIDREAAELAELEKKKVDAAKIQSLNKSLEDSQQGHSLAA